MYKSSRCLNRNIEEQSGVNFHTSQLQCVTSACLHPWQNKMSVVGKSEDPALTYSPVKCTTKVPSLQAYGDNQMNLYVKSILTIYLPLIH